MKLLHRDKAASFRPNAVSANALLASAVLLASVSATAQQGLPEAQPLNQRPAAERQPQAQQSPGQAQPGQTPQAGTQQQTQQGQNQQGGQNQSAQGISGEEQLRQAQSNSEIDPRAKDGDRGMYEARVEDLRDSVVVDMAGVSIGYVQDIVVKQDHSEAGLVISTGGQQEYVYVPLTEVRLEGEQLLLTSRIEPAPVSERELQDRNFNQIPDADRPLSDYLQPRQQGRR
jgi:sporulation protein YlmC with PRC-barrel domain